MTREPTPSLLHTLRLASLLLLPFVLGLLAWLLLFRSVKAEDKFEIPIVETPPTIGGGCDPAEYENAAFDTYLVKYGQGVVFTEYNSTTIFICTEFQDSVSETVTNTVIIGLDSGSETHTVPAIDTYRFRLDLGNMNLSLERGNGSAFVPIDPPSAPPIVFDAEKGPGINYAEFAIPLRPFNWRCRTVNNSFFVGVDQGGTVKGHPPAAKENDPSTWLFSQLMIRTCPNLEITKKADADPYVWQNNFPLTYKIIISNTGDLTATNVVVTDILPKEVDFISASLASCILHEPLANVSDPDRVICKIAEIPPQRYLEIEVVVQPHHTLQMTTIKNIATATDHEGESVQVTETTQIPEGGGLKISKSDSSDPYDWDSRAPLTYTIMVTNSGTLTATNVVVRDPLPEGVEFISVSPFFFSVSPPKCAYIEGGTNNSPGTVVCQLGDIPPQRYLEIEVVVQPHHTLQMTTIKNIATATDLEGESVQITETTQISTTPPEVHGLQLSKTVSEDTFDWFSGAPLTYTIIVMNNSPFPAPGVVVTDTLPKGLLFVSVSPDTCNYNIYTRDLDCPLGTIPAGGSETVVVAARPVLGGVTAVNNAVAWDALQRSAIASAETKIPDTPKYELTVDVAPKAVAVGDLVTVTIKLKNVGKLTGTGIILTYPINTDLQFVTAPPVICVHNGAERGGYVNCDIGNLAPGGTVSVDVVVRVAKGRGSYNPEATYVDDYHIKGFGSNKFEVGSHTLLPNLLKR